jgi:hypothetical protein
MINVMIVLTHSYHFQLFSVGEDADFSVGTNKGVPILKKCSEEKSKGFAFMIRALLFVFFSQMLIKAIIFVHLTFFLLALTSTYRFHL